MPPLNPRPPCPARCPARCPSRCQLGRALGQISVDRLSEEQALGMKEQEWAGPEALCPGWQEEEVSDGEGPEDSGHPDPTAHAYEVLQHTLRLEGMPLTIDRTGQPRTGMVMGGTGWWGGGMGRYGGSVWPGDAVPGWGCGAAPWCQAGDPGLLRGGLAAGRSAAVSLHILLSSSFRSVSAAHLAQQLREQGVVLSLPCTSVIAFGSGQLLQAAPRKRMLVPVLLLFTITSSSPVARWHPPLAPPR